MSRIKGRGFPDLLCPPRRVKKKVLQQVGTALAPSFANLHRFAHHYCFVWGERATFGRLRLVPHTPFLGMALENPRKTPPRREAWASRLRGWAPLGRSF